MTVALTNFYRRLIKNNTTFAVEFMRKKMRHIIISYILLFVMQAPMLLQLEHIFDNEHGVVYKQNTAEIHKVPTTDCAVFHKHLNYIYWIEQPVFLFEQSHVYFEINQAIPDKIYLFSLRQFQLRAPPCA